LVGPLLHAPTDSSLVVGLYGEWGHGKTSALKLLELALDETRTHLVGGTPPKPQAQVVRFTPWLYSSVDTLLPAFFETLSSETGGIKVADGARRTKLKAALRGIGEFVGPAVKLGALVVAGPAGSAMASAAADALQGTAKATAEALDRGEPSFRKLRDEASDVLLALGHQDPPQRVVVLIDDLDRAAGVDEVLAMLKLVKLVADLPNVSYVLAMDRERVQALLRERISNSYGDDFLDKIIQIPISLPPVLPEQLSRLLVEEATRIAEAAHVDASVLRVDWNQWELARREGYEPRLRHALRTLRDVARILNAYRFSLLTGEVQPAMHAVDLLFLSVLQTLYPHVYENIRKNRSFLLHEELDWSMIALDSEAKKSAMTRRRDRLLAIADLTAETATSLGTDTQALEMIEFLFPNADGEPLRGVEAQRARNDARIRSPERFDGYFRLQPPEDEVPRREVESFFTSLVEAGRSDRPSHEWAPRVAAQLRDMPQPSRMSLVSQLDDRASAMTVDEARLLTKALAPLARAVVDTDIAEGPIQGIAAHTLASLSSYRMDSEQQGSDLALGVQMFLDLIAALPVFHAAEYAERLTKGSPATIGLSDENRTALASAGLHRSHELLASTPDIFAMLKPREAVGAVWTCKFLAARAGTTPLDKRHPPLQQYLEQLLDRDPARLSDVISLAAGWGERPDLKRQSPPEVLNALSRLLDVDLVKAHARDTVARGVAIGTWPYIVEQFVDLFDPSAQAAAAEPTPVHTTEGVVTSSEP